MKASPAESRILVASDNADDARQISRQLGSVFADVRTSTNGEQAVADFEACRPDVLVLAFDTLLKSERYYLGLYRLSSGAVQDSHRTVVLCSRDDVAAAFELCRKDYFDDYVLFWPQSYDGHRLAMSVWTACRQTAAAPDGRPGNAELIAHARHLEELERVVADSEATPAEALRARLAPALAGTRPLAATVKALKLLALVVDDDEFAQRVIRQALDPARWNAIFASDAAGALAQLRRHRPDLILMDVRLPGVDGVALTRRLKASPEMAAIPVLMITGDARRETLLGSVDAGAVGFVVKPVTRSALQAKLDKILPR